MKKAMSLSVYVIVLWSAVLLSERRLLGGMANAEATVEPTCTTSVGGRCERAPGGCQMVEEGSDECMQRLENQVDLQQSGCRNTHVECDPLSTNFCEEEQAINITLESPVNIYFSVPHHQQFNVTASLKGNWSYVMVMTGVKNGQTVIAGNRCVCGSTDPEVYASNISRTDIFNTDIVEHQHRTLHLCLWNKSRRMHLVQNFSGVSSCSGFVDHYHLPSHLCNQPLHVPLGQVRNLQLIMQPTVPPMMQVSWEKPDFLLGVLHGITYYLTLHSALGIHNFSVSDSTNVTFTVSPGLNYTVTVRTQIWCEANSCQQTVTESASSPLLPTTTTSTPNLTTTTTATEEPAPTAERYDSNVMAVIIFSLVSALTLLLLVFTLIVIFCKWRARKSRHSENESCRVESPRMSNSCSMETASTPHVDNASRTYDFETDCHTAPKQVLIVGSLRISTQEHVELAAAPLKTYKGIELLMHNVDTYERLTPSKWVQQAMDRAEFVLCICNREFKEDWDYCGQKMCHETSLIRSVSEHVAGLANHGQSSEVQCKFVVVLRCEEDKHYIPENLKNCNLFVLDCDANIQSLARYLLGIPAFTFQRSDVDSIPHISSRH